MASIEEYKGKKGTSYYVVYRLDGKQHKVKAGCRMGDARKLKAKIEHEINSGAYQELKSATLKEFALKWLDAKKADVRPKTFAYYRGHVLNNIIPFLGDRKLRNITTEDIEAFKASLIESNSKRSKKKATERITASTVGKCLIVLRMLFKTAVIWGYASRNPAQYVKRPSHRTPEIEFLTPEEIKLLIEATEDKHRCLIATAAYTGMRQSELLALKWEDIDFLHRKIFVRRTLQQGKFFDPKSSASRRAIDIPKFLVEMLEQHQLGQMVNGVTSELNLVFPNEVGKPMDRKNLESRIFKPALRVAGLRSGINFHSLRHSYASMLIHQGTNVKYVQKQLGHSNVQLTLGTYSHLLPEAGMDAINRIDEMFNGAESDKAVIAS